MNDTYFKILSKKIIFNRFKVGIIGLGYVGLPLVKAFAKNKIRVIGFDNDHSKVKKLRLNQSYITSLKKRDIQIMKKTFLNVLTIFRKYQMLTL